MGFGSLESAWTYLPVELTSGKPTGLIIQMNGASGRLPSPIVNQIW